jgi:chorismate mutase
LGKVMGIGEGFMESLLKIIHQESIHIQTEVMNRVEDSKLA